MRFLKAILAVIAVAGMTCTLLVSADPETPADAQPVTDTTQQEDMTQDEATEVYDPSEPPSGEFELVSENDAYVLFADIYTGNFVLRDRTSGRDWYSYPTDIRDDKLTKGAKKTNLRSMLVVYYVESATIASSPVELFINSYVGSVLNDAVTVQVTDKGFSAKYFFTEEGFTVPVEVALEKDGLHVRVRISEIENATSNLITRIDLLPGFLSAGITVTDGALFVPSGSGALVQFGSHKGGYGTYSEQLYGEDSALNKDERDELTQGIQMPVYGIIRENAAMSAIITSGDTTASIFADGIGPTMGYNRVYAQYQLAVLDSTMLFEADYFNQRVINAAENRTKFEDLEVCFAPLSGEKGNLGGIAETYRNYLLKKGVTAKPQAPSLALTLYGAATRKASFLGIPYEKTFAMTTFDQAAQIVTALKDKGVNVALRYEGWTNTGLQNKKIPVSVSPVRALGGKKGYQQLLNTLHSQQTEAYFDVDFRSIRKTGRGFSVLSDTIKTMFNTRSSQYRFMLSTGVPTLSESPWYMVRATEIPNAANRFAASFKNAAGISLNGFGDNLYSDFYKKNSLSRQDCLEAYAQAADSFKDSPIAVTTGNAYTYTYADRVFDLSQSHNGHLLFDESVPFMQMVLHGVLPYTSEAVNRATDVDRALLDCIAYGSDPYYIGIGTDASELVETNFTSLYSTSFSMWDEEATAAFLKYGEVYAELYDDYITDYEWVEDGVSKTTFSDGTRVLVNRTPKAVTVDGTVVESMSYSVSK